MNLREQQINKLYNIEEEIILNNNKILEVIQNLRYISIELAIIFTRNTTKEYYNSRYTPIKLNISEIIYLRLYKGYQLLRKLNYKISK